MELISKSTHQPTNKKPRYLTKRPQDVTQFPALPIGVGCVLQKRVLLLIYMIKDDYV